VRRPGCAAWLLLAAVALPAPAAGQDGDLERVREAIEESRERVATYEREERGLLEALEAIERSEALLRREAERARRSAREAREALARAEADAEEIEARLAELERAMAVRANALYRAGELGAVRLVFSAGDLRGFFRRVQTLRRLLRHDTELLASHREQSRALAAARTRASQADAAASAAERALARRTRELAAERERKRVLVARMRQSRTRERRALAELEVAARALEETVAAWGGGTAAPAAAAPAGPGFAALEGRLPTPLEEGRLRGGFGRVVDPESRTATFRKGVTWAAPRGEPVHAVAAGRVRFAGPFRGYGNTVIVDHGDDYFTVSAHLARIDVERGAPVAAGDALGAVGESGSLSGPKLYFEVRRGGRALDPEAWLASFGSGGHRR